MKSFSDFAIPVGNIIGFGSDGCGTMMGAKQYVSSSYKAACPGIYIMKHCHSAHLCASEACKQLPQSIEELARDVHNTLKHSSKRMAQFCEFQEFAGVESLRILSPLRTRWLSYSAVTKRMLEQWGAQQLFFTELHHQQNKSYSHAVKNAYELLHDPFVRLHYCFLESVLPKFIHLNLLFQSEKVVINALHSQVCSLYKDVYC
ncbi:hypothetical protein E2C01_069848 [Portunus trituberculatus]|uniref:Uncharacterized protein n=1 Tax=Portunus trituberculatus TaxID=210409 RepID=A0A5B7HSM7_PORTR|nr:hypothetical protein [Portunus trituberculatus]